MRPYLLYLFALAGMVLLIGAGVLLSRPAGAQPVLAARAGAPAFAPALSPTPCPPAWTILPDPAPPGESALYGVTALAPNDLWAVGYSGSGMTHTLTVHGDGTTWTQVPSPDPTAGNVALQGVAGVASNDVWAVGSYLGGNSRQTLTEHWNGTAWTIVPSPNVGRPQNHLYAVTAIAGNDVWAVGGADNGGYVGATLIEHWNGNAWTIVPSPNPSNPSPRLYGIAAVSATDVWAVGGAVSGLSSGFVEHWNGSAWSIVPSPSNNGILYAVTAVAANDVWAVGHYYNNSSTQTLIEHWDGSAWTIVPSPSPGAMTNHLYGVSARASNDVWAVGDTDQEGGGGLKTLAEHWDGSAWTQVPTPDNPTGRDHFYAVAVPAGGVVWAVGESGCSGGCLQNALIARYGPLCLTPTPTPSPCSLAWRTVPSPSQGYELRSVAVVTANDVWTVGVYYPNSSAQALIEHWDGYNWSIVPSPNPGAYNLLYGVAAVAANDVWAVGYSPGNSGQAQTLIEHWDGSSWSIVPSPNVGSYNILYGIASPAANNIWAVGEYANPSGPNLTLIEHWNGSSWSIVPSPNPGNYNILNGIAAAAGNDIWAVGVYANGGPNQTLTEHWNGSSWSIVPSPNPGTLYNTLSGVAAVAANDVRAVGDYQISGGRFQTLIEHWNGSGWSIVPSPNPGTANNILTGVAVPAANDVWAVGEYQDANGPTRTLTEHWNGSSWSVAPSPNGYLYGVAAVATNDIWAVGSITGSTLIVHYNDPCSVATTTPTRTPTGPPTNTRTRTPTVTPTATNRPTNTPVPTPPPCGLAWRTVPSPSQGYDLRSVAVVAANDIWAVGYYFPYDYAWTLTEHWDGSSWSIVPSPNADLYNNLYGVVAVGANDVWAVGSSSNNSGVGHTLTEHWDGTQWTVVPSPNPGAVDNYLWGVAAVAGNDVWAIGVNYLSSQSAQTLIEHWNGTSWSIVPSPSPGTGLNDLHGVAVVAANDVWAVGRYQVGNGGPYQTLIEHWNGSSWSIVPSPNPDTDNLLYGVEAVSGNDIWAVGTYFHYVPPNPNGPYQTLIEHWDGSSWSVVPSPNPGTGDNLLHAVAVVGANDLWAVGEYNVGNGAANLTLTEHWDGSSWSIVPSPSPSTFDNYLYGVAAAAANDLWAVGIYYPSGSGQQLIEHYNDPCGTATAMPTSTPTNTPTSTSTRAPTVPPTQTPISPSATPVPTNSPIPTGTPLPTQTPGGPSATPVPTNSPVPTSTPLPAGTATDTPTRTATPSPTETQGGPSVTPVPTDTPCPFSFSDVHPTDYFYTPVLYLACHGVISGYSDGTFRPYNNTTRSQMVKIVVLGFQKPITTPSGGAYSFTDVPPSNPFFPVVETAYADGIVSGYTCGTAPAGQCDAQHRPWFLPYNSVTRAQLSKIDVIAAGWTLINPTVPTFTDVSRGSTFYTVIETAVCHGVVSGYSDHTFRPYNNATRGQIAKIVYLSVTTGGSCRGTSAP